LKLVASAAVNAVPGRIALDAYTNALRELLEGL
jgi:hypothetical protein